MKQKAALCIFLLAFGFGAIAPVQAGDGEITLIHTGDFHGHLVPRPNLRSDGEKARMEGGLARIYHKIKQIRKREENTLLLHTGDTIQGSAEALYTHGQAMVDVVNYFGVDAFAPGNWDYVYGTQRFLELFAGPNPTAPWNAVAANLFYTADVYPDKAGQRVLPPYLIKQVGELKVGILGFTTDRGPQVVGSGVTRGMRFLRSARQPGETLSQVDAEVQAQVAQLRNVEKVDLLVMLSELGLANNIRIAESIPGIDVILSADMHEETHRAVVAVNAVTGGKTVVVEEGQDGTMMGEIKLEVVNGRVAEWKWKAYNITDEMEEDEFIARKIKDVRKTFVAGPDFVRQVNPFNGSRLQRPIDTVVGYTLKPLHRSNFSDENMPGVIEGSSHDFLTDAFRAMTGADIGAIRGFRYGTHVAPGRITMEDLYHFVPIGPQIATGKISGQQLKNQIENAADGSLNPNPSLWTGGWLFNFSNVTMDLDPYQTLGLRASNINVGGLRLVNDTVPRYTYASYWYPGDPCMINVVVIPGCTSTGTVPSNITILKDADGSPLDGTEVVVRYLASLRFNTVDPVLNRTTLLRPLPAAPDGMKVVQPLRGATLTPADLDTGMKETYHKLLPED